MAKLFGITVDFNQEEYIWLELVPFLLFYLLLILFYAAHLLTCVCDLCWRSSKTKLFPAFLRQSGYIWLNYVFGHHFKETKDGIIIRNYKFRKGRATTFGLMLVLVICLCFEVFWDTFLLTESTNCEPGNDDEILDCFFRGDIKSYNCSSAISLLGSNTNYTSFRCYQFVWNLSGGISAAGGTLTIFSVCTSIVISFFEFCYDCCKKNCSYERRCCATFFQVCIMFLSVVSAFIIIMLAIHYRNNPYVSTAGFMKTVSLLVALFFASLVWHCCGAKTREAIAMEKANKYLIERMCIWTCKDFPDEVGSASDSDHANIGIEMESNNRGHDRYQTF